jgi:hypothetical protein
MRKKDIVPALALDKALGREPLSNKGPEVDQETALRQRMLDLKREMREVQHELDVLHGGPTGPLRWGERVRTTKFYNTHAEPPLGSEGKVDYVWADGQVAVQFDSGERGAYWPYALERVSAKATETKEK